MERRQYCHYCYYEDSAKRTMEKTDDGIDSLNDGDYLRLMDFSKRLYEKTERDHKKKGCVDHTKEEYEEEVSRVIRGGEVEVEEFVWNGVTYLKSVQQLLGCYWLYDRETHIMVGRINNGQVIIY